MPPKKQPQQDAAKSKLPRMAALLRGRNKSTIGDMVLSRMRKVAASRMNLDEELEWLKPKALIKPDNQLDIPDADLDEDVGRVLTTMNPRWKGDQIAFNYGKGEFVKVPRPTAGKAYILYSYQGTAIRKDSDEAKMQIAAGYGMVSFDDAGPKKAKVKKAAGEEDEEDEEEPPPPVEEKEEAEPEVEEEEKGEEQPKPEDPGAGGDQPVAEGEEGVEGEEKAGEEEEPKEEIAVDEAIVVQPRVKKLANQFNFCERAALTYNNPFRAVETQTEPPKRATYGATALQSIIYDYYQEDYKKKMAEKEGEKVKRVKKKTTVRVKTAQELHDEALAQRIREAWSILERLVNQNIYDDIAQDYRYWEDPSDEFRDGEGSLLPLWKFSYEKMRQHAVADLMWNQHYFDLFAVAYGSLDFTNPQKEGCLCLYSIKNPAYPEYAVITDSPIVSLDVHHSIAYLIAVGRYDGNVCVYNAQLALEKNYQYKSNPVEAKHSGIVWEVRWGPPLLDGEPCFFSIAGDGKVIQWAVMPGELLATTIIRLKSDVPPVPGPDGTLLDIYSCGSCLTLHPTNPDRFFVGTEDGMIHECSRSYSRDFVRSIKAHHMPVYRISFNHYNENVFISCSADWRVKIWEYGRDESLFVFDLGACVGDVKWAPYSSTVFAACTSEGKLFVFDLNVNKYKPICVQNIVSKKTKKLTRIDFNHRLPVIVCGDTKGQCHVLKLSPNLRIMCKPPKKQQFLDQKTLQIMKLEKLLSLIRDPPFTPGVIEENFDED